MLLLVQLLGQAVRELLLLARLTAPLLPLPRALPLLHRLLLRVVYRVDFPDFGQDLLLPPGRQGLALLCWGVDWGALGWRGLYSLGIYTFT